MTPGANLRSANFRVLSIALVVATPCLVLAGEAEKDAQLKIPQPSMEQKPIFTPVERPMPSNETAGSYQMRCWQRGQLLFTEGNLSDPTIAALPGRIVAFNEKTDSAVYLVEVAESLCLIKRRKGGK
jgi:hypothetical protein